MRPTERAEAPHISQELLLPEHALGVLGQRDEELVLLGGELHGLSGQPDHPRGQVDLEVSDGQARVLRRPCETLVAWAHEA
jgi:hypothetical protein